MSGYDASDLDSNPSPKDNDAHGTACAGIIGASTNNGIGIAGIARNCMIMPIRHAIHQDYSSERAATGITWARNHGADIISCSFNPGYLVPDLDDAIDSATTYGRGGLGCVIVFSSGNTYGSVSYPATRGNVISVGATNQSDEKWDYSGSGIELDVVAPSGELEGQGDIWTTDISGSRGVSPTDYMSTFGGTSAACPLADGTVKLGGGALMLGQHSVRPEQAPYRVMKCGEEM